MLQVTLPDSDPSIATELFELIIKLLSLPPGIDDSMLSQVSVSQSSPLARVPSCEFLPALPWSSGELMSQSPIISSSGVTGLSWCTEVSAHPQQERFEFCLLCIGDMYIDIHTLDYWWLICLLHSSNPSCLTHCVFYSIVFRCYNPRAKAPEFGSCCLPCCTWPEPNKSDHHI